ncbi:MAG: methyl-accepting chemotaxis protein [Chloroflexi bacterium]|nr:methyl-accepting chemotaxis protein [Chloroflexota bacterium]
MKLKVGTKLYAGFGVIVIGLIVAGFFAVMQLNSMGEIADKLFAENLSTETKTGIMRRDILLEREQIVSYPLAPAERRSETFTKMMALEEEIAIDLAALRAQPGLTARQVELLDNTEAALATWYGARDGGPIAKTDAGDLTGAANAALYGKGGEAFTAAFAAIGEFAAETKAAATAAHDNALATKSSARNLMIGLIAVLTILAVAIAYFLARSITGGVNQVGNALKLISQGDLSAEVDIRTSDELGEMSRSYAEMKEYMQGAANVASKLSEGDLDVNAAPKSSKDELGNAFTTMVSGLKNRADVAKEIAQGNLNVEFSASSERDTLGNAYVEMVQNLKERANVAEEIALGNLNVEFSPASSKDTLGNAYVSMVDNLKDRARVAEEIAKGNLGLEFERASDRDMLGNAFLNMVANLRQLIGKVSETANSVASSSTVLADTAEQAGNATQEIAALSQQVATGAEREADSISATKTSIGELQTAIEQVALGSQEQASAVQQASSIVSQVSSATQEVAKNAVDAAAGSHDAAEAAERGQKAVKLTMEGMGRISAAVDTASNTIGDLGEKSAEIGKIVGVIDDIAAQTNLLALNAAIEAARAGEQGRGFAVVADEVRKLAERVTDATKEIATLVDTVQTSVVDSVKATEEGAREVKEGTALAGTAGEALVNILAAVETVTAQVEAISAAAEQVSASSDEMVRTIESVSATAEENSATAEQMSASSTEVSTSVDEVQSITIENAKATKQTTNATESLSAQVEEVVASSQSMSEMATDLQKLVGTFNLGNSGGQRRQPVSLSAAQADTDEERLAA